MDTFLEQHVYSMAHWPFFLWAFIAMMIGQVMKSAVWTKIGAHTKGRWQWVRWWGYKTLPLHPVIAGAGLGFLWVDPEGRGWPLAASVVYFAAAGALSVWLYQILKGVAKSRGVDLNLPGSETESTPPPISGE